LSLLDAGLWSALITILGCATTCYAVSGSARSRTIS
jgi:hypothetical protein